MLLMIHTAVVKIRRTVLGPGLVMGSANSTTNKSQGSERRNILWTGILGHPPLFLQQSGYAFWHYH